MKMDSSINKTAATMSGGAMAPTTAARPHPVFEAIAREFELFDGQVALHHERFEFWAKRCWTRYPRAQHRDLYEQLGALAFELARRKWRGALQAFALATLGLDANRAEELSRRDAFLRNIEAQQTQVTAKAMAASAVLPALREPATRPATAEKKSPSPRPLTATASGVQLRRAMPHLGSVSIKGTSVWAPEPLAMRTAFDGRRQASASAAEATAVVRLSQGVPVERRKGADRRMAWSRRSPDRRRQADRRQQDNEPSHSVA